LAELWGLFFFFSLHNSSNGGFYCKGGTRERNEMDQEESVRVRVREKWNVYHDLLESFSFRLLLLRFPRSVYYCVFDQGCFSESRTIWVAVLNDMIRADFWATCLLASSYGSVYVCTSESKEWISWEIISTNCCYVCFLSY